MATIPALDPVSDVIIKTKKSEKTATHSNESTSLFGVWGQLSVFAANQEAIPSPRVGSSFVYNKSQNSCWLFGGASHEEGAYNDVFTLTVDDWSWHRVSLEDPLYIKPEPRYEHGSLMVDDNTMLILYGAGTNGPLDDIWKYDIVGQKWTQIEPRGMKPCPRSAPSLAFVETPTKRLYMFSGGDQGNRPVSDTSVYCFDVDRSFWVKLAESTSEGPTARMGHSMVAVGSKLFLFGGLANDRTFGDLWSFDLETKKWRQVTSSGPMPSPRSAHAATVINDRYILIHGGFSTTPKLHVYDDIYVFDTLTAHWTQLDIASKPPGPPGPRLDHSTCLIYNDCLSNVSLIQNGTEISASDQSKETTRSKAQWILFGGMDFTNVFNEVFELEISL